MARNVIQIPIIKSSNNGRSIVGPASSPTYAYFPMVSDLLYLGTGPIGLAWNNSLIPNNKKIVSIELKLYANGSIGETKILRYAEFGEGSEIAYPSPPDKSISLMSGWNSISLDYPTPTSSVVIGIQFPQSPYTYFNYITFNSHRNANNKPYILVTYDDIPPDKPTSLYPSGITVSTRDVIRFAWLHNSKEGLQQKGFILEYSIDGGTSYTTISETTANQYYDMPANTLPTSGTVLWRVKTIDGNDEVSEYSSASFTLGVVPQKAPIPIAPISQYLDENKPIRFEWSFVGGSGSEYQSKFDLQYSTNGGSTWTTKTVATPNTFYELPANTFSGGNVLWRVRTYNNWDEVSPYSENKSFTVIGSPPIPLISSITNSGRPTIIWQSTNQHIYELQILKDGKVILDSGSIPSTSDRSFKLPIYLQDGNYLVKLRIANEYNLYSPWAEKSFIISTVKPQKPIVEIFGGEYSVTIKVSNISAKTLLYRDSILIGEVIDSIFIDYTGENNKEYQYFIRTIDSSDNFSDSDIKLAKCKFSGNTLALVDNPQDFIKLKTGLNSNPKKSNIFGVGGSLQNYDGRKYPVIEFSEFNNMAKTLSFYVRNKKEIDRLIEMIEKRKIFIYRNRDGANIYGTILSVDYDEEETFYGYEIGFTITKTEV